MTQTVEEIDRILMSADVEFLHGVPVHMNQSGAQAIREALTASGFAIVPVEPNGEDEADLAQAGAALEEFEAKGGTTLEQLERDLASPGYQADALKGK